MALVPTGCTVVGDFSTTFATMRGFFGTTPFIPVTPLVQKGIEDRLWENERYDRVPILDPIEGQFAPVFCMDPPSDDEVMRTLPSVQGGVPFLHERFRNNVRIVKELIADYVDEPRFYPLAGPAQLHHCHFKCTVYYDGTFRTYWPIPFTHHDETVQVVYIDHDHLHRVGGGPSVDP
jgi:hypothetical protein